MSNKLFRIFVEKIGGTDAENYIGNEGELFYDPTSTSLRISDGTTPGGSSVSGGSYSVSRFVAVNYDGTIAGSSNGIDWNDYSSPLTGVSRVAVGPNKIVYIADNSQNNNIESLWYADSYDSAPTEVSSISTVNLNQVKYFSSIAKFIAVGSDNGGPEGSARPVLYWSSDAINWNENPVSDTFIQGVVEYTNTTFNDIDQNSIGFLIVSDNSSVGGFFISHVTDTLDGTTNVPMSDSIRTVTWAHSGEFTGWHAFGDDSTNSWYYTANPNPGDTFSQFIIPSLDDFTAGLVGYAPNLAEVVIGDYQGLSTIMLSTVDGQTFYWPIIPAGPYVSVPKPYTSTITDWTSDALSAITIDGETGSTGEKFTVTGSTVDAYNGTYYLDNIEGTYVVYTDIDRTTAFDTTGLEAFTGTATITWSHGQYIDALHYSGGIFYAGNDDEEVFRSTDGGETWVQVDQLTGMPGEDIGNYLNDIDSFVGTVSQSTTGDITFDGLQIIGAPADDKFGMIKLVPAASAVGQYGNINFLDSGQFVKIYPTNEFDSPHIHIAAGSGIDGEGDILLGDDNKYVQVDHYGEVSLQSYNAQTSSTFKLRLGSNGNLYFPLLSTDLHNGGLQSAQTLQFGDGSEQVIITGPTPDNGQNAQRLIIQGQRATGGGEGGDVYLWGGDAQTDGGDIKIYAGDADNAESGYGGYVNIDGGAGFTQGGAVSLRGGNSTTRGGDINIIAGSGTTYGTVTIGSGSSYWKFAPDGITTVPTKASPASSIGQDGDLAGMMIVNNDGIYYCVANFDGTTNIWRAQLWNNSYTW